MRCVLFTVLAQHVMAAVCFQSLIFQLCIQACLHSFAYQNWVTFPFGSPSQSVWVTLYITLCVSYFVCHIVCHIVFVTFDKLAFRSPTVTGSPFGRSLAPWFGRFGPDLEIFRVFFRNFPISDFFIIVIGFY